MRFSQQSDLFYWMVEQMLELHKRQAAASVRDQELYQRHAKRTPLTTGLTGWCTGLYDLAPEEIAIVENQGGKP